MAATAFYDLVKCGVTGTPGTGSMTLGSAVAGYRAPAGVIADGAVVSYGVEDAGAHEVGTGTYTSGTGVLTRTLVASSTGSLLNLTSAAIVHIDALARDIVKATAADLRAMTDETKAVTPKAVADAMAYVALTDASTVAVDLATGINFTLLTTSGVGTNRTFGAPSNGKPGQTFTIEITTDAANRTAAYNVAFKFPGATVPAITTTSGRRDRLVCQVNAAGGIDAQLIKDVR